MTSTTIEIDDNDNDIDADLVRASIGGRGGRPPASRAGEIDRRILDAASQLFLARGFAGTSCEQVAVLARAGKASIYARFPDKAALFSAVIRRDAERVLAEMPAVPTRLPLADRLLVVGCSLTEHALDPGAVALLRVIVAEAPRFPELASHLDAIGRDGNVRPVAEAIACRAPSAAAIEQAVAPAEQFVELVVLPLQMRALLGDDLAALRTGATRRIETATALLTASGWLDGWS